MNNKITVTTDGTTAEVEKGTLLLEAATIAGIDIPRLCFNEDLEQPGTCGMCIVSLSWVQVTVLTAVSVLSTILWEPCMKKNW
ncbi:MAG: 2Fe-2S iron-sulfur cluster-binding protein [Spirochaetia bacterium]